MAQVTARGRFIAWELNPYMGTTSEIQEACSLIGRHAVSYSRIQELWCSSERVCNTDWLRESYEKREASLEARILDLVESLPHTDNGPVRVEFQGDPRGSTVKLLTPSGKVIAADEMDSFIRKSRSK
jgi:hypothetical protein